MADSTDLLFRIRSNSDQARSDVKSLRDVVEKETKSIKDSATAAFNSLGQSLGFSASQMAAVTKAAPIVGAGIGVVATAAVGAGAALFAFVKRASDTGSELFDLSKKLGLSAEVISSVKFAADQSGSSIGELGQAFVLFQRKLTDFLQGGKEAATLFGSLGVSSQRAAQALKDPDDAMRLLAELMNGPLPAGYNRSTLAADLLGRSGANLVSTFNTLGANLDEFIEKARRMGVTLTEEDLKAADEFGDTLDTLGAQLAATGNKAALSFAPAISRAMQSASDAFTQHRDTVAIVTAGIVHFLESEINKVGALLDLLRNAKAIAGAGMTMGPGGAVLVGNAVVSGTPSAPAGAGPRVTGGAGDTSGGSAVSSAAAAQADDLNKKLLDALEKGRKLREQLSAAQRQAFEQGAETAFKEAMARAEAAHKKTGDLIAYIGALKKAEADRWSVVEKLYKAERGELSATIAHNIQARDELNPKLVKLDASFAAARAAHLGKLAALESEYHRLAYAALKLSLQREFELEQAHAARLMAEARRDADARVINFRTAERAVLAEQSSLINLRRTQLEKERDSVHANAAERAEAEHKLLLLQQEAFKHSEEAGRRRADATLNDIERAEALIDAHERLNQKLREQGVLTPSIMSEAPTERGRYAGPVVDPASVGPPPGVLEQWQRFGLGVLAVFEQTAGGVQSFASVVGGAFGGVARAIGTAAAAWLVYGQSFGAAVKQALASAMAAVAAEAFVQAIVNTAKGFAALAGFMPGSAAMYFKAAGLWAIAGVAAGGAGRALAGGGAGGASPAIAGNAFGGSTGAGDTQSERDRTIREARAGGAPDPLRQRDGLPMGELTIKIDMGDNHVENKVVRIFRRNGNLRAALRNDLLGEAGA